MKVKYISILILLLSFSSFSFAQSKKEKQVAAVVEKLRKAMIDADAKALDQLVSDSLSYGHSGGVVESKAAFIDKLISGKSDFVTIELLAQTISVNRKTAIVRHKLNASTNDNGKAGEVHLQILLVFQKKHGKWKLLARQAIKLV